MISKRSARGIPRGLTAREKLVLQVFGALVVGIFLVLAPGYDGVLSLPFLNRFIQIWAGSMYPLRLWSLSVLPMR